MKSEGAASPQAENPSTRKRRLQKRLKEISDRSEQELASLKKSIEQIKSSFKSDK